jgi:catechol 2,3-dioxygenase-like lactoylglutathione lyase family enzyme
VAVTLDHVVLRVPDLARAVAEFNALGFSVTAGGKHPAWDSENALIGFADRTYLELIAFPPPAQPCTRLELMQRLADSGDDPLQQRVGSWSAVASGLVDYAVRATQIGAELERLRSAGIAMQGPFPGSRERPDGRRIAWEMGVPPGLDLPFICADVTPLDLRVPGGDNTRHANGCRGVAEVVVLCRSLDRAIVVLGRLFAAAHIEQVTGGFRFDLQGWSLRIIEATTPEQLRHVDALGDGPWQLRLNAPQADESRAQALAAHGLYCISS